MGLEVCEMLVSESQDPGLCERAGWEGLGGLWGGGEEGPRREAGGAQYKRHRACGAPATPSHFCEAGALAVPRGRERRAVALQGSEPTVGPSLLLHRRRGTRALRPTRALSLASAPLRGMNGAREPEAAERS